MRLYGSCSWRWRIRRQRRFRAPNHGIERQGNCERMQTHTEGIANQAEGIPNDSSPACFLVMTSGSIINAHQYTVPRVNECMRIKSPRRQVQGLGDAIDSLNRNGGRGSRAVTRYWLSATPKTFGSRRRNPSAGGPVIGRDTS